MFGAFNLASKAAVSITPNKNCSHRISTPVYIYLEIIYWRTTLLSSCKAQMFSHGIFPLWGCHLKMLNGVLWILFNLSTLTKQRLQKNCCPYPLHFICRELKGKPGSQQNNFSYSDLGQPGQGWVWGESKSSFLGRTECGVCSCWRALWCQHCQPCSCPALPSTALSAQGPGVSGSWLWATARASSAPTPSLPRENQTWEHLQGREGFVCRLQERASGSGLRAAWEMSAPSWCWCWIFSGISGSK